MNHKGTAQIHLFRCYMNEALLHFCISSKGRNIQYVSLFWWHHHTSKSNTEIHHLPWLEPHIAWTCTSVGFCLDLQTSSCPCRSHTEHSPLFFCRAHILHTFWPSASPEDNHTTDNESHRIPKGDYLFSPWKWMGVDVTQRIIFILKQSAMQPVTFIWLSESSFCNHMPYNTLLTCSNYCKSILSEFWTF